MDDVELFEFDEVSVGQNVEEGVKLAQLGMGTERCIEKQQNEAALDYGVHFVDKVVLELFLEALVGREATAVNLDNRVAFFSLA